MFMNNLKSTLNEDFNYGITENGALGYRTSGKELLDLNFAVSSLRNASDKKIVDMFTKAYYEDPMLALKFAFYSRDIREGLGERRLFRVIFKHLSKTQPKIAKELLYLIPEYGRFDDLTVVLDTELAKDAIEIIRNQLDSDIDNCNQGNPISLCAKWLPSENASSKETKRYARIVRNGLGLSSKVYRKLLSKLRKYLRVTETYMSSKKWDEIDYQAVPSRANLIYNSAFLRNDEDRRREFLDKLEKGEAKINSSVLFPHDIVHKYIDSYGYSCRVSNMNIALEEMWKALPDMVNGDSKTIVVADGSGSMTVRVGDTNVSALTVANALAIYFSERCTGQFKDNYITFSENPRLVNFSKAKTLRDKIELALRYNEVANTNIEKTFDLILRTAINSNMSQEDLPNNVLILSDMEFDSAVYGRTDDRLFETISKRFENAGYKLPRLIFWNLNSRTGTIPVKENELGVALVSGFSPNVCKMVMSDKLDPYECLLDTLNTERYNVIEDKVKHLV